jgi:viologen exporter family transport system permease protein
MASLLKFWLIFRLVWIERMVYRVNFFLDILSGILSSLIVVFLWIAIYRNTGSGIIGGYSMGEMVTYLLGGGLLNSFILTTAENPETSQSIQDGTLSTLLIKPFNPYAVWFARDMGGKTFLFMLGVIGYLGVLFFFREYLILFASPGHLFFFVFSVLLAALLQFLLFEALSLLSFWIENTYGMRFTMRVILEVAGGAIIPLSFFPGVLQEILMLLPFPYMIYLPMQIYLGKIPLNGVPLELLKESVWLMGLILLNFAIWKRGARQYVSMGD